MGPHLSALQQRTAQGLPTPAIDHAPELYDDLAEVWTAFVELSEARPAGWGLSPIPWTEIEAWLRLHGVRRPQDQDDYATLIRGMDRTWLAWQRQHEHGQAQSHC